jgi:GSH-dependent disulfide-bond oxidoreductase
MIDFHFSPTPNGLKVRLFLEEAELAHRIVPISLSRGEQFRPEFVRISPNSKMPAIVDYAPAGGGEPIPVFESGAILLYLAEKTGRFVPSGARARLEVLQWLFWQVGGLGPMAGQAHHFLKYSPQKVEYAMHRFRTETARLYKVMDKQLAKHEYLAGEYSIADIAAWPWVVRHDWQEQNLDDFPNVKRWFGAVGARPAVKRGAEAGAEFQSAMLSMSDEDKKRLFNLRDKDFGSASR